MSSWGDPSSAMWATSGACVMLLEGHISCNLVCDLILKLVSILIPKNALNILNHVLFFSFLSMPDMVRSGVIDLSI